MTLHFENPNTSSEGVSNGCVLSDEIDWSFYDILSPFSSKKPDNCSINIELIHPFFLLLPYLYL